MTLAGFLLFQSTHFELTLQSGHTPDLTISQNAGCNPANTAPGIA
jgi:hypothetical protein